MVVLIFYKLKVAMQIMYEFTLNEQCLHQNSLLTHFCLDNFGGSSPSSLSIFGDTMTTVDD